MANERRRMGGRGQMPVEKAKDFKGSIGKLFAYMKQYHAAVAVVILCAIASTVFSVIGPDILGKATTELSNGLLAKIQGTGSIDFTKIGQILLFVLGLYLLSTLFGFVQGWLMTGVTQKVCYRMRKDISEKIDRMPMAYFESRTYGEVLSRITNDVDTLRQLISQSIPEITCRDFKIYNPHCIRLQYILPGFKDESISRNAEGRACRTIAGTCNVRSIDFLIDSIHIFRTI